jgi:hypothetical protein
VLISDRAKLFGNAEAGVSAARLGRRGFLAAGLASVVAAVESASFGQAPVTAKRASDGALKIDAVELMELRGRYTEQAGVDGQAQVNPLDVYDDFRPQPYKDQPSGTRQVQASAVYLRIRTAAGLDGLYGPIEKSAGIVVHTESPTVPDW